MDLNILDLYGWSVAISLSFPSFILTKSQQKKKICQVNLPSDLPLPVHNSMYYIYNHYYFSFVFFFSVMYIVARVVLLHYCTFHDKLLRNKFVISTREVEY